ncbi:sorbitol dehydrogenase-like [Trichogramma pretiosum]|uniref:sorbitol dehydrogenase-like n=1 Tax=Trichogramma pretiosum TaxID=7493 RepID=UPI0006C9AEC0|nr:sorbitol dehydrogenase-like [Trichogramma pretiosum]
MAMENISAILHGINDLRLENTKIKEPKNDEVLLKMACVGICGSDVHYLVNGRIGDFILNKPMIMGHEASGTVIKLGKEVKHLQIGDKVAIEPGIPCRICNFCKKGKYNLCAEMKFCATPPIDGNLQQYYTHPADLCFKLPKNVTLEEGALAEPLSVAVHACKRAKVRVGSKVMIIGAGTIGLMILVTAKAMGADKVVIADVKKFNLEMAKKLGADGELLIVNPDSIEENIKNIKTLFEGFPNITIDATGVQSTINLALLVTEKGGSVVLVGMGSNEVKLPLIQALTKEVDIKSVFRYANDYSDALNILSKTDLDVKSMITHRFKLHETIQAFEEAKSRNNNTVKVMIYCD